MDRREPRRDTPLYRYRFGAVEFDEARQRLTVDGQPVELEQRPLQLLAELLRHPDEVVTREELLETVWAGRPTVDNVLANAVTKLRRALGEAEATRVTTLPRIGYRLSGPVDRHAVGRRLDSRLALGPGQPVPAREHFLLERQLGPSNHSEVWLARHVKTREPRVFKFSPDGERLALLKREATLYRVLLEGLGERDDLARVLDWNFEAPPFFLECEYGGVDLKTWAETGQRLGTMSREQRLALFLSIADAVAAAHSVGVLHKDLKPANVLMASRNDGWQARVTDFGSGRLLDPERLEALGITRLGLTVNQSAIGDGSAGTPLYLAPELLAGETPTVRSDVYALGLMLYQLLVGDLGRPMASGWEQDIGDDLLCADLAAATAGNPARRLAGVAEFAERLRRLDARREQRISEREADLRVEAAQRLLVRTRARRPWMIAAIVVLVAGLAAAAGLNRRAERALEEALRQAELAGAINRFVNEDLLGNGIAGGSNAWYDRNPSLREILDLARSRIAGRFDGAPLIEAGIHATLGRGYRTLGDFKTADVELRAAYELQKAVLPAGDERLLLADYEWIGVLLRLSRFDEAGQRLAAADAAAGARLDGADELALRARLARGAFHYQQLQPEPALAAYRVAETLQRRLRPDDWGLSAHIRLSLAGSLLRLARPAEAETEARAVVDGADYSEARIGLSTRAFARKLLGDALRNLGKPAEALPQLEQSVAEQERARGPDDQLTITALSSLGYLRSLTGDPAGALATQREVYQRAARRWGADSQFALIEQLNLGDAEVESGDAARGLPHLQAAFEGLAKVSGAASSVVQSARFSLAHALTALGRHGQALALLEAIDAAALATAAADAEGDARLALLTSEALIGLGRRDEARMKIDSALARLTVAEADEEVLAELRVLRVRADAPSPK
jgi:DNA-binding winged helix-turn-helix (wHTH) protein/tetratricopeptide (TPR) repeat protein